MKIIKALPWSAFFSVNGGAINSDKICNPIRGTSKYSEQSLITYYLIVEEG